MGEAPIVNGVVQTGNLLPPPRDVGILCLRNNCLFIWAVRMCFRAIDTPILSAETRVQPFHPRDFGALEFCCRDISLVVVAI